MATLKTLEGDSMERKGYLAIDIETFRFGPGNMRPKIVCLTYSDGIKSGLFHHSEIPKYIERILDSVNPERPLVMQNGAYDLGCIINEYPHLIPKICKLYEEGAICDTKNREKLIHIAKGVVRDFGYSLKDLAKSYLDLDLDKSTWRLGYEELYDKPKDQWPEGAIKYAIEDALVTGQIYELQKAHLVSDDGLFLNEAFQNRADFSLFLMTCNGMFTDAALVKELETRLYKEKDQIEDTLVNCGLLKKDKKGKISRNMKAVALRIEEIYGDSTPRTAKGGVKADKEVCEDSGDLFLTKLAKYRHLQTKISKDLTIVNQGITLPIHTSFNSLVATGRTSSYNPNLQNLDRKGGIRDCFMPRKGYVFVACDYGAAELHTLAQVCYEVLGHSRMGDKLNEGIDLHLDFGASLLGVSYEDAVVRKSEPDVKEARQIAKVANFGFPGGMGIARFVDHAKQYGLDLTESDVKQLKDKWLTNWPELAEYFQWINGSMKGPRGNQTVDIVHLYSNRRRGQINYTTACNSYFQGLASDGAKEALWLMTKEILMDKDSPLNGSLPIVFVHDEIIVEAPIEKAAEAAVRLGQVMEQGFNKYVPQCPVQAEPFMMTRWYKDAEPMFDEKGRLIPWTKK